MINKEAHFFLLYTNEASRFKNLDRVIDGNIAYFDHGKFKCDLYNQFRHLEDSPSTTYKEQAYLFLPWSRIKFDSSL